MLIKVKSIISGVESTQDLPVTIAQLTMYVNGQGLIQDIFPNLTPKQREFIKYGFTEEEFKELYGE